FAPDGQSLAVAPGDPATFLRNWKESRQGEVKLLDAATGKSLPGTPAALIGHEGSVWAAAFHPGGRVLATAGQAGHIRLWDTNRGKQQHVVRGHAAPVISLAWKAPGEGQPAVLATGSFDRTVKLWDADAGKEILTLKLSEGAARVLAFSPDGKT